MKSTFLALLFAFSQYSLWLGASSVSGVVDLNDHIKLQQQESSRLAESIRDLEYKVNHLKQQSVKSSTLLENHMRWKLGLIKKGEWFCRW